MRRLQHGVKIMLPCMLKSGFRHTGRAFCDHRGNARGFANFFRTQIVAISIASPFAGDHAHAHTKRHALGGALNDLFINSQRAGGEVLKIEVGILAARRKRLA